MNSCFVNDTSWVKFNVKLYMEDKRGLRGGCRDRQKYRKENWNIFSFLRSWNKLDVWAPTCVLMACLARFFLPDFFPMLALLPISYFLAQIPLEPPHLPLHFECTTLTHKAFLPIWSLTFWAFRLPCSTATRKYSVENQETNNSIVCLLKFEDI